MPGKPYIPAFWGFLLALSLLACTLTDGAKDHLAIQTPKPTQTAQAAQDEPITCTVTALETLNLRATPGTSAAVTAILNNGEEITILPHPTQGNWIRVQTDKGEGWINQTYCERNSP